MVTAVLRETATTYHKPPPRDCIHDASAQPHLTLTLPQHQSEARREHGEDKGRFLRVTIAMSLHPRGGVAIEEDDGFHIPPLYQIRTKAKTIAKTMGKTWLKIR